jgi:hypothetical protein
MILALSLSLAGLVLSIHFATVKTIFGLFWRTGYQPPPDLMNAAARVEKRWGDPAFFPAVSLGRTVGTFLLTLGLWLLVAPDLSRELPFLLAMKMLAVLVGVYLLGQFLRDGLQLVALRPQALGQILGVLARGHGREHGHIGAVVGAASGRHGAARRIGGRGVHGLTPSAG